LEILRLLAGIRNPFLNVLMLCFSYLSENFFILVIVDWIYLNTDKRKARGIGIAFFLSALLCQGIRIVTRVPRPWNVDTSFQPLITSDMASAGYSFPSMHMQAITSFCLSLFYLYKNKVLRTVMIILIAMVALSRLYLGLHLPSAVIAGFLFAAVLTLFLWFRRTHQKKRNAKAEYGIHDFFMIGFALILLALSLALYQNAAIDLVNARDSFSIAGMTLGFALGSMFEHGCVHFSSKGSLIQKIGRYFISLGVTLLIEYALVLTDATMLETALLWMLMTFWMVGLAPWLFTKIHLCSRE
jgi:undecaprenyl-diphosphatase